MKSAFFALSAMFATTIAASAEVALRDSKGWFESCFVSWANESDFDGYNVYVKPSDGEWRMLDAMLVRNYGDYGRADAVGLKAGKYSLKVVPKKNGEESVADATVTPELDVRPYDRTGFAHFGWNGGVGAYNNDGTLKANARVIYVSAQTAKTVTAVVNGVEQKGLQAILDAYEKGKAEDPLAIRIVGKVSLSDLDYIKSNEEGLNLKGKDNSVTANVNIEGVGDDATIHGFGVQFEKTQSVEIRNVAFMCAIDDCLSIKKSKHVWVHNNDYFYGSTGGDADQAKGDGSIDVKDDSQYITYSYNTFWDSGKMSLCGMKSETGPNFITYHHNWFNHSDSRHPRVRTMSVHVYNNYYDGVAKYGVGAAKSSDVFVEANYFRNTKYPMLTSLQGSDVSWGNEGTFSKEPGGVIKAFNNVMVGAFTYVPYAAEKFYKAGVEVDADIDTKSHFDAYEVVNREEPVPAEAHALSGGHVYNNFDTDASLMYSCVPDDPQSVPTTVTGWLGAGRMGHGDFQWTFDNATEDENYDVIKELKAAIVAYESKLVNFYGASGSGSNESGSDNGEGSGSSSGSDNGGSTGGGSSSPSVDSDWICFFDAEDKAPSSANFKSTGSKFSLSTSKGSIVVNDETYSTCLKLESGTKLSFSLPEAATVYFYFGADQTAAMKLDGDKVTESESVYIATLEAGDHYIEKSDSRNLYLIVVEFAQEPTTVSPAAFPGAKPASYFTIDGRPCDASKCGVVIQVSVGDNGVRRGVLRVNK